MRGHFPCPMNHRIFALLCLLFVSFESLAFEGECRRTDQQDQTFFMKIKTEQGGFALLTNTISPLSPNVTDETHGRAIQSPPKHPYLSGNGQNVHYHWTVSQNGVTGSFLADLTSSNPDNAKDFTGRMSRSVLLSSGARVFGDEVQLSCELRLQRNGQAQSEINPSMDTQLVFPSQYSDVWSRFFGNLAAIPRPTYDEGRLFAFFKEAGQCWSQAVDLVYYQMPPYRRLIAEFDGSDLTDSRRQELQRELRKVGDGFVKRLQEIYLDPNEKPCFSIVAKTYLIESISTLLIRNVRNQRSHSQDVFSGHEMAVLSLFLLNAFSDKIHVLTPEVRNRSICPFQKRINVSDHEQYAILAGYNCETAEIYFDPFQSPLNLAAIFIHEVDHLLRDKLGPVNSSEDLTQYILLDETLAALSAAYYQKAMSTFSHGEFLDSQSNQRIQSESANLALFRGNGIFSRLFDMLSANSGAKNLSEFLSALFFQRSNFGVNQERFLKIADEVSNVYFGRSLSIDQREGLKSWLENTEDDLPSLSPLANLEDKIRLKIEAAPIGTVGNSNSRLVTLFDKIGGQLYATNVGETLDFLQKLETIIRGSSSSACQALARAYDSSDQLEGYLGKSSEGSCSSAKTTSRGINPNGHGVIPGSPIRLCIQPSSRF